MLEVACKKSSKILVVLLSAADTPVLKLGKIVFSCTLEVIKGQMICFDQKYVSRSDVSHFPSEALEATSKSATLPFLPSAQPPVMGVQIVAAASAWVLEGG